MRRGRESKVIAAAPGGSGCKHRRKRAKDILKHAAFDSDRNAGEECHPIGFRVDCIRGAADPRLSPLVMLKVPVLTGGRRLSAALTVDPPDHRSSAGGVPTDPLTHKNSGALKAKVMGSHGGRS